MDAKAIETLAVNAVRNSVVVCDLLDQFIPDNDKEPSWDGHVYIYKDKSKKKNGVRRIPVQVKGTEKEDLSQEEISFSVSTIDLKNYLNDGGAIFFVVYIGNKGLITQIYYTTLTPIKLRVLLANAGNQKTKNVKLTKFPSDPNEKTMIILNCWEDCQKQKSFNKATLPSLEELEQQGVLESISFSVTTVGGISPYNALLKNEVYLYANIKGGAISQPIEEIPEKLITQEERDARIMVGRRLFYTKVKIIRDEHKTRTVFGDSLSITTTVKTKNEPVKINYKGTHMLRRIAVDLDFMLSCIDNGGFSYNGTTFPIDVDRIDFSNFPIEEMRDRLKYYKKIVRMLDLFRCKKDIDLSKLQRTDWKNIDYLIKAIVDEEPVANLKEGLSPVSTIDVGDLKFAVCMFKEDDASGTYRISDYFTTELLFAYTNQMGEELVTSQYYLLHADDFLKVDNIRYDVFLPSFQNAERNSETMVRANYFLLELLKAYDKSGDSEIINTAAAFSEWIMTATEDEVPYSVRVLNDLQIKKRRRTLTSKEEEQIYHLIEMPNVTDDTLVGAYLLLGQQTAAKMHFDKLEPEIQAEFREYPIFHFWNDGGQQ